MLNQTDYSDKLCQGNLLFRHLVKGHNAMSPLKKINIHVYMYIFFQICVTLYIL